MDNKEPSAVSTYVAGEDPSRLKSTARKMGLRNARQPLRPVRDLVEALIADKTLESARMHSVGALAKDERVDASGTLHLMTVTRRRVKDEEARPEYGQLTDLFRKKSKSISYQEEDEDDDYEEDVVDVVEGGSLTAAVFGIIKGSIGSGVLYLPRGFQLAGYAAAIPAMLLSTSTFLYSAYRLLQCWKAEKAKVEKLDEIRALLGVSTEGNYGSAEDENGKKADGTESHGTMLTYPELARRAFGKWSIIISIAISLMQFGVCLTYLIYIPQNLVELTRVLFGREVHILYFLIATVAIEIPLSWIIDIRKLALPNILATLLIAYGLVMCLAIALTHGNEDGNLVEKVINLQPLNNTWYLFVGTSFYMFEGIVTLLVPLQDAVYLPEDKEKFADVNRNVISCIVVFYIFFAIVCWASFGDDVKTALTASLPEGIIATSVQIAYSIAIVFTFPLQNFPALEVVLHSTKIVDAAGLLKRNVYASLIICCLGVVAYLAIDSLGNVVSLLGSLVGVPLALMGPPLMHNQLVKDSSFSTRMMNYTIVVLGFIGMIAASYSVIVSWGEGAEG